MILSNLLGQYLDMIISSMQIAANSCGRESLGISIESELKDLKTILVIAKSCTKMYSK